ncbi:PilZ domain-containing protein [Turneriella parva]|uniref:Type IV pilus assembly PilZ n=1 Tax=Turneriella parva (strain ATCC BAA-1111 / DSM 21527 / NCTC 11395 / H) TaxID=869212 RepID=I4B3J2_TURPD|nr:PilZ domain-containing protein [Turneriella parva]AFM11849.1 type IV pilus assembly PilZ [Turneriella parva DSM 21527]
MSILRQSLALQIMPIDDNPEGNRYQGVLENLGDTHLTVRVDEDFLNAPLSEPVRVDFTMSNFRFRFDSQVEAARQGNLIRILKPTKLYKSVIRKGQRLKLDAVIGYNVWTEPGRYEAVITDLSPIGLRMITDRQLPKNTLISVNVYLPGKSLRFICQGLVRWCTRETTEERRYTCGVLFTTLSNESTKRVEKFVAEELQKNPGLEPL